MYGRLRVGERLWPERLRGCCCARRERACVDDFDGFDIADLPDIAHLGMEVLNRVQGMPLAERALTSLYERYLREELPAKWKDLFKDA